MPLIDSRGKLSLSPVEDNADAEAAPADADAESVEA